MVAATSSVQGNATWDVLPAVEGSWGAAPSSVQTLFFTKNSLVAPRVDLDMTVCCLETLFFLDYLETSLLRHRWWMRRAEFLEGKNTPL